MSDESRSLDSEEDEDLVALAAVAVVTAIMPRIVSIASGSPLASIMPAKANSNDKDYGIPTPEAVASTLHDAIASADHKRLQGILQHLCQTNSAAMDLVTSELMAPLPNGTMRKMYEVCKNCRQEFNVITNTEGDCVHHPGKRLVQFLGR